MLTYEQALKDLNGYSEKIFALEKRVIELETVILAALDDLESNNEASAFLILKNAVT